MVVFEILMIVSSFVLLFLVFTKSNVKEEVTLGITLGSTVILLIHFAIGFVRWQFTLIYITIPVMILVVIFKNLNAYNIKRLYKRIIMISFSILLILSLFSILSFPIYEIPTPSGEYDIGTKIYSIESSTRLEAYSDQEYRRFMIQAWYPAESVDGYEVAPWLYGGIEVSRSLASDNYLPKFALDHTVEVSSNSYLDAPIKEGLGELPVIIISHGWRGFRNLHTDFAEELASQGYFVVSIDHTYGSVATVFAKDDIEYLNLDALQPRDTNPNFLEDANELVYTYAYDVIETLDYIEELNQDDNSIFHNQLDIDKIGHIGHSTGGGAGVAVALMDPRVEAVFGLDSWVEPIGQEDLSTGLTVPSVFIRSGWWETGENNEYLYNLISNTDEATTLYQIDGTTHYDFAMVYMYSPLTKLIGFTGSIDNRYLTDMLETMMIDFFDEQFKEVPSSINYENEWDEVQLIEIP